MIHTQSKVREIAFVTSFIIFCHLHEITAKQWLGNFHLSMETKMKTIKKLLLIGVLFGNLNFLGIRKTFAQSGDLPFLNKIEKKTISHHQITAG